MAVCEKCKKEIASNPIKNEKLLLVEGKDELNFFTEYLKFLGINDVDVIDVEGKSKFKSKIVALSKIRDFEKVKKIFVIVDADNSYSNTFNSLNNILKGLQLNKQIDIFIMPDNKNSGSLEDLCLKLIDNEIIKCVDSFFECINFNRNKLSKRKIQIFLATQDDPVNSIGLGAMKNYWDFNSKHLDNIKNFLLKLK